MKGLNRYLIFSALLLVFYLVAQYYKPVPTDWTPTYLKEDKIPFGTYILHHQLQDLMPEAKIAFSRRPVYNALEDVSYARTTYIMIASSIKMDALDFKRLKKFMAQGNHVFIASFSFGSLLENSLKLRSDANFDLQNKAGEALNFTNPALKAVRPYVFDKGIGDQYFSKIDTGRAIVLGNNKEGKANFVKYTFGKGALYILPNPQLFTNYSLLNPSGAEYAAKALSYLPIAKTIIWDELNTVGEQKDNSPLAVVFRYVQLRWAYYLSMITLLLFVLFEVKRRQRIIPVLEPLKNTSLEFVEVVGRVYYRQGDNIDLATKMVTYLMEHIRNKYRLKTTVLDETFEDTLAVKSGISRQIIQSLFLTIKRIQRSQTVDDDQLIQLNKQVEIFYKQAQ